MENQAPENIHLYQLLGKLDERTEQVLNALKENRIASEKHRSELREEITKVREEGDVRHSKISARLDSVEKFNVRVLGIASVILPILMAAISYFVPIILSKI